MNMNTNTPVWAHDIPLLDPETRAMSERAVNLAWAEQIERQADERERWRQVLAPEMRRQWQPFAVTGTGIRIGSAHQRPRDAQYATGIHGPYRRHPVLTALRKAAVWCLFVGAGVVAGAGITALAGCSLASDSEIEELVALDLADAIHQAGEKR